MPVSMTATSPSAQASMFSNASTIRSRAFYDAARTEKREDLDKVCAGGAGHFCNSVKPALYGKKLFCGHSLSSP
jgi:hypothetical protein